MKIDFHIHAFPDAVAKKAMSGLVDNIESTHQRLEGVPTTDGTIASTRKLLAEYADIGVLMPIATRAGQQKKVNNWAAEQARDGIMSFGSVYPFDADWRDELDRIKALGLKGVKLHPDYQGFDVADRAVYPVYEKIEALGLPVLFHTGYDPVSPKHTHCPPAALADVARDFPFMTVIAAHLGGNFLFGDAKAHILGAGLENVYVDTSVSYFFTTEKQLRDGIRMIGAERVLFATDMPWSVARRAIESIDNLGLSEDERNMIYCKNAKRLLKISED